jgi:pseudouridine synthase
MKIILQKYISSSGYCSRRKAEELIRAGRVRVNGKKAEIADYAEEGDKVEVDGKLIKRAGEEKIYIFLNKPVGYTCTNRNFKGEKNVFELLDKSPQPPFNKGGNAFEQPPLLKGDQGGLKSNIRLFVVGRLDKNSRGLVILTNDGDFAEKMAHPRNEKEKEYEVRISNFQFPISKQQKDELISFLTKGVDIGEGDGVAKAKRAEYLGDGKFRIILTEGKKRQIRRMFKALGLEVADLTRVRIGEYRLGGLKEGEYRITHNA